MLHEQGNLPMTAANETKTWQHVAPLTEANARLAPLVSAFGFHSLIRCPSDRVFVQILVFHRYTSILMIMAGMG
jgi:hypothetical protein